jgi:hypothetical protein
MPCVALWITENPQRSSAAAADLHVSPKGGEAGTAGDLIHMRLAGRCPSTLRPPSIPNFYS